MADPLSTSTNILRKLMGKPVPPPPGRIPAMLAARREMVDAPYTARFEGVDLPDGGWMPTKRLVEPNPIERGATGLIPQDWDFLRMHAREYLEGNKDVAGFYDPEYGLVVYPDKRNATFGNPHGIRRHEVMHGYNHAARMGAKDLPLMSRVASAVPHALSRPLDELIAQRVGGRAFMEIPWDHYANQYAAEGSAGAARVARALIAAQNAGRLGGRAIDFAVDHPGLLGAGVGAAYTLNRAMASEEE